MRITSVVAPGRVSACISPCTRRDPARKNKRRRAFRVWIRVSTETRAIAERNSATVRKCVLALMSPKGRNSGTFNQGHREPRIQKGANPMELRKLSIFVDGPFRRCVSEGNNHVLQKAFGYAIAFPAILLQLLSTGHHRPEELPKGWNLLWKLFDGGFGESQRIESAFNEAHRVEAVLKISHQDMVGVEVSFYLKVVAVAQYELHVSIGWCGDVVCMSEVVRLKAE